VGNKDDQLHIIQFVAYAGLVRAQHRNIKRLGQQTISTTPQYSI
jgi:hypothetical protein